jgi:hypothetical protein
MLSGRNKKDYAKEARAVAIAPAETSDMEAEVPVAMWRREGSGAHPPSPTRHRRIAELPAPYSRVLVSGSRTM